METITLIIMLLIGNADFEKGKTVELDMSGESESIVLTYQDDGWVTVDIKDDNPPGGRYMSILFAEKSLTFKMQGQTNKMSRDDFTKTFEVEKVSAEKGYDFTTLLFKVSNGHREEVRHKANMRLAEGAITVESQGKTTTYTILKNHNKPDAGDGK